jgi:hypothetical protein
MNVTRRTPFDMSKYSREVKEQVEQLLDVAEKTWGFRPPIELVVEPCLVVRADFNLNGFAHKGQKTYVTEKGAAGYRKATAVARRLVGEIVAHRDTCKECGENLIPLWARARGVSELLTKGAVYCYYIQRLREDGRHVTEKTAEEVGLLRPADAIERAVNPRTAARLDALIAEFRVKFAPQPEPLDFNI